MANALLTPALFDSLTTGSLVRVTFESGRTLELKVGRRSHSAKYKSDSITLNYLDGRKVLPRANRVSLSKRANYMGEIFVSMGVGDMAAFPTAFEVV
jgi:hypothetical protein